VQPPGVAAACPAKGIGEAGGGEEEWVKPLIYRRHC